MSFPTGGNLGWEELRAVTPAAPIVRPLPVAATAQWYDPTPLGAGVIAPSIEIERGGATVTVYTGASLTARFHQPNVFGVALLDAFGIAAPWLPFPFRFSWPMRYGYLFLTDVLTAADGSEQRIAIRNPVRPRRRVSALVQTFHRDATYAMLALLHGWNPGLYGVPLWWDSMMVTADVALGALTVPVLDATTRDLPSGRIALLWVDHDEWEIVGIDTVAPGLITLLGPTARAWPRARGPLLVPLRLGHLGDVIELSRPGAHLAEYRCDFLLDPDE